MPELPGLFAKLRLDPRQWQAGLASARNGLQQTGAAVQRTGGRMAGIFQGVGGAVKNVAGQIPFIGGALTQMMTPVGAATVAVGALVGGLVKAVTGVSGLERELRPMIERSGASAESLQVLSEAARRLGSEDGLEGVTDGMQELQLRLAEAVQDGTGPAVEAFRKLGLASEDLIEKSPEESFLAVITALQGVTNEADRKFLADELMGGASEKLSGIVNENSAAFQALTADIRENGNIVSNEGVESARVFNDQLDRLKDGAGRLLNEIGIRLMPVLTQLINFILAEAPKLWREFQPVIEAFRQFYPVVEAVARVLLSQLKGAFDTIVGAVQILGGLLTGDFSLAWEGAKKAALGAMRGIVEVYNQTIARLPGVAKIDIGQIEEALLGVKETAEEQLQPAMVDVAETTRDLGRASGEAATEVEGLGTAVESTGEKAETAADRIRAARERIREWREDLDSAEAAISDGLLPTLDELIDKMAEKDEATEESFDLTKAIIADERQAYRDWLAEQEEIWADRAEAEEAATKEAEEAAERRAEALRKEAEAAQREVDRINSSWDRFIVKQDETVKAMDEAGIEFADLMDELAIQFGMSTVEMANHLASLGVTYGDTLGLMEQVGRNRVNNIIQYLKLLAAEIDDTNEKVGAIGGQAGGDVGVRMAQVRARVGAVGARIAPLQESIGQLLGSGQFGGIVKGAVEHRTNYLMEDLQRRLTDAQGDPIRERQAYENAIAGLERLDSSLMDMVINGKSVEKMFRLLSSTGSGTLAEAGAGLPGIHYLDAIERGFDSQSEALAQRLREAQFIETSNLFSGLVSDADRSRIAEALQLFPSLAALVGGGVMPPTGDMAGQAIENRITLEIDGHRFDDVHVTSHSRNARTGRE